MKKPIVKSSKIAYSGFYSVKEDILEREDGLRQSHSSLILGADAAVILAQDSEGRFILNREYRHSVGKVLLGAPGGRLDEGEDPLVGGQRELFEETGYWSDDLTLLGSNYPFPGICNQKIYYLYAKNCVKKGQQQLDPFEFIETELLTEEQLHREIFSGKPMDGLVLIALWYKSHRC